MTVAMFRFKERRMSDIFIFLFSLVLFSCEVEEGSDYSLTKYHVDMIVNENNTFDITERISVHFEVEKHGVNCSIPLNNNVVRFDGIKSRNRVKVTNVCVEGDIYEEEIGLGKKIIKIGDPEKMFTGSKDYVISYLYDIGKDPLEDYDELYYHIIGIEWDTSIDNLTFSITMPKDFDASTLGFSSDAFGATQNDNISYEVNGLVISGSYNGRLKAGDGLAVRMALPEGYFVRASGFYSETISKLSVTLPICFVFIVLGLWFKYGKDTKVIDTVDFYPPKGYNSAEIGFFYKGKADAEDVVSLLIYLANKGYFKIIETTQYKTNDFTIKILKDYDGNNPYEKCFLNGLIKVSNSEVSYKEAADAPLIVREIPLHNLTDRFYSTLNAIKTYMNRKKNMEIIFEKNSLNIRLPIVVMIIASLSLITVQPMFDYFCGPSHLVLLLFPVVGLLMLYQAFFTNAFKTVKYKRLLYVFFILFFGLIFCVLVLVSFVLPALLSETVYWTAFLAGIICIVAMCILGKYMKKRTPLGNELLGKIKGFRRFLITAEKHTLEQLVNQSPDYFYDILPFAYVLDISNIWVKKFESIAIIPPDWYAENDDFSHSSFSRFMDSTMKSASSAMSSDPTSNRPLGGGSVRLR